jgi:lysophospholipase L1-like esterase
VIAAFAFAMPASASAARLYLAVGDSVGAGFGATGGHSFFDLYCAYLKWSAGGTRVDQCVNESVGGLTSQAALAGGTIQKAVTDIDTSTDTPVVTVVLGGNDLLGSPGCQPITGSGCQFIHNLRTILNQLETALGTHPGSHVIQVLEYYNPNYDNPFGNALADRSSAGLLLGSDLAFTACSSTDLGRIGLDDAINCIANEKGATPIDAYTPFQSGCTSNDCFSDSLHPDDEGYGLIFAALRDTSTSPVPTTPPPDGSWPFAKSTLTRPTLSVVSETRAVFAPSGPHRNGGTVFSFRLDQAAEVRVAIERQVPGRRVGRSCALGARLAHNPRCTRTVAVTTLIARGRAGLNRIAFSGRVRGQALAPGRYLAVIRAIDAAGASAPHTLPLTIRRA